MYSSTISITSTTTCMADPMCDMVARRSPLFYNALAEGGEGPALGRANPQRGVCTHVRMYVHIGVRIRTCGLMCSILNLQH